MGRVGWERKGGEQSETTAGVVGST